VWRLVGRPTPLAVEAIPSHCRAIVLAADAQIPYGTFLSAQGRSALARWAHDAGGHVIEIACDTVLRPELNGVPCLSTLAGQRSILIGGFDELLTPALRLGYAVLPGDLAAEVAGIIERRAEQPSNVCQLAMESMLADGTVSRLRHRLGRLYARKRLLVERVFAGSGTVNCAVIPLPPNTSAEEVAAELLERSVRVETLAPYYFSGPPPQGLVVGYGHVPDPVLALALDTIADVTGWVTGQPWSPGSSRITGVAMEIVVT
jgi:GntR family transcriptional regulator / MocR family aminotransferase